MGRQSANIPTSEYVRRASCSSTGNSLSLDSKDSHTSACLSRDRWSCCSRPTVLDSRGTITHSFIDRSEISASEPATTRKLQPETKPATCLRPHICSAGHTSRGCLALVRKRPFFSLGIGNSLHTRSVPIRLPRPVTLPANSFRNRLIVARRCSHEFGPGAASPHVRFVIRTKDSNYYYPRQ